MQPLIQTDIPLPQISPLHLPSPSPTPQNKKTIQTLTLQPHQEGGYYTETDRHPLLIPNPHPHPPGDAYRTASSTILYYLPAHSPIGHFHLNRSRTIHTHHRGRGRYVILHSDEESRRKYGGVVVESFVVGEGRVQWVVEGGKFKASYLLDDGDGSESGGLLISETVVPGFEAKDHEFLTRQKMEELLGPDTKHLHWLLKPN